MGTDDIWIRGIVYRLFTVGVTDVSAPAWPWTRSSAGSCPLSVSLRPSYCMATSVLFSVRSSQPLVGNVLMPIIFILSAIVSGIALCVFNYMVLTWIRRHTVDMRCLDTMAMFLFYALVVDASVEGLDWIHRCSRPKKDSWSCNLWLVKSSSTR